MFKYFWILTLTFLIHITSFCQPQKELLTDSYEKKDTIQLQKFFKNWSNEIKPINDSEYSKLTDVQKDVYDVFYEFYNPVDLSRMNLENVEYDFYKGVKYLIIKNQIKYNFIKTLDKKEIVTEELLKRDDKTRSISSLLTDTGLINEIYDRIFVVDFYEILKYYNEDSILNFHPRFSIDVIKPLILLSSYEKIINGFLGNEFIPLGANNIMQPAYATGESLEKIKFLRNYIMIMRSHWGDYWEILSSPKVRLITFDELRDNAMVYYEFPWHAGRTFMSKINGKWTFIYDRLTLMW